MAAAARAGCWAASLLLLRPVQAPIPCTPRLRVDVEVGSLTAPVSLSRTIEHHEVEERECQIVNYRYEDFIVIGCMEGTLNATAEKCFPRRCLPYQTVSVRIGNLAVGIRPNDIIMSGNLEVRLCREVNPEYRGEFLLKCYYGDLSVDVSKCTTQWDPMEETPWQPRSRHTAVGLSDGSLLLLGGLGFNGPLQQVWHWWPGPSVELGSWEQLPEPPWSGRFGAAALRRQSPTGIDQVVLLGGNDGQNRRDVWQWDRAVSVVPVYLESGYAVGTQREDCTVRGQASQSLHCNASAGVIGRRWDISGRLQLATEVHLELKYTSDGSDSAVVFAVQLDDCRLIFAIDAEGQWTGKACADGDPRIWQPRSQVLGPGSSTMSGSWQKLILAFNRETRQAVLSVNGNELLPVSMDNGTMLEPTTGKFKFSDAMYEREMVSDGCPAGLMRQAYGVDCTTATAAQELVTQLRVIDLAVWPNASIEVRGLSLKTLPGNWRLLAQEAPWPARTSHAVVDMPDGDILLMGGLGSDGLLNDVWRWSPMRCTLLPSMGEVEAAYYELECGSPCVPSVPHGQWQKLGNAPWSARLGHAVVYTTAGVLMTGGRTDLGFVSDAWRFVSDGPFCSLTWQGRWEQLVAVAPWSPRFGHSIVGFAPYGTNGPAETVLILGGFGGEPEGENVTREPPEMPIQSHHDMWCGNLGLSTVPFSTWTQLTPTAPFSKRSFPAAVVAPTIGEYAFVFFGGYDNSARHRSDFWRWVGENATAACKVEEDQLESDM